MKNLIKGGPLTVVCFIVAVILVIVAVIKDMSRAGVPGMNSRAAEGIEYISESFEKDMEE